MPLQTQPKTETLPKYGELDHSPLWDIFAKLNFCVFCDFFC